MSVQERIKTFIKSKNLSVSAFESSISVSNGYVNSMRKAISNDKLNVIVNMYPELNISWLLLDEGEMLKNKEKNPDDEPSKSKSFLKINICKFLEFKNISKYMFYKITGISNGTFTNFAGLSEDFLLIFINYFEDLNIEWLMTGKGRMIKGDYGPGNVLMFNEPDVSAISYQAQSISLMNEDLKKELKLSQDDLILHYNKSITLEERCLLQVDIIEMLREKIEFLQIKLASEIAEKKLFADIKKIN